ncbi:DEAD/DEAH box helicase family protein [Nocardia sp. NPDC058499]|uniref:DEAD/DEAH box helicase family protein n=1 Tax=Nocardia sp. NPDC058499 TaxID=3346530 RepID=UPI00364A4E9A
MGDHEPIDRLTAAPPQQTLRYYQVDLIARVEEALADGVRNPTVYMAPGTGKTTTAFHLISRLGESGVAPRVLYLAKARAVALQALNMARQLTEQPSNPLSGYLTFSGAEGFASVIAIRESDRSARFLCAMSIHELDRAIATYRSGGLDNIDLAMSVVGGLFDLVVIDEWSAEDLSVVGNAAEFLNSLSNASTIRFASSPLSSIDNLVFSYEPGQALADGFVIDYRSLPTLQSSRWGRESSGASGRVFIVCAEEDRPEGHRINVEMLNSGFDSQVKFADQSTSTDPLVDVLFEMGKGDVVIYCLSPYSVDEPRLQSGLDRLFARRGTTLLFAIVKPCVIPRALSGHAVVDAMGSLAGLVNSLKWANIVELSDLRPVEFTNLVSELLSRIGFSIGKKSESAIASTYFQGVYRDYLGLADPTEYIIQVKCGPSGRISVRDLWAAADRARYSAAHILLITNFQLTSLAIGHLTDADNRNEKLRVLDGLRIKNLLLNEPDLVAKYFPLGEVYL